jgi:hypothetical protein
MVSVGDLSLASSHGKALFWRPALHEVLPQFFEKMGWLGMVGLT